VVADEVEGGRGRGSAGIEMREIQKGRERNVVGRERVSGKRGRGTVSMGERAERERERGQG